MNFIVSNKQKSFPSTTFSQQKRRYHTHTHTHTHKALAAMQAFNHIAGIEHHENHALSNVAKPLEAPGP